MNIYVANVPFKASDDELKGLFEEFGNVTSAKIITDKFTHKSRGFGFVEMNDDEEARKAIETLNGADFMGKNLVVNEAKPRTENTGGGGGGFNRRPGGGGGFNKRPSRNY